MGPHSLGQAIRGFALGLGLFVVPVAASAAPITYNVNHIIGAGSIVGTIQTDGTVGVLSVGNFLDWILTLSSPNLAGGSPDVITKSSGNTILLGSALSATPTALIFNFAAGNDSGFALQGASGNAWCMATGPIACMGEPTPSDAIFFGTSTAWAELRNPTGPEVIASAAVPEPATLMLFGTGLCAIAAGRRRRMGRA
jgi:hypothetical protein